MRVTDTALDGVKVLKYDVHTDCCGYSFPILDRGQLRQAGLDYAVDLRPGSSTYLQWVCVELSAENRRQILIPKGFGHAFLALEDNTRNVMRFDEPFDARYARQVKWNDPRIGIDSPIRQSILAPHDVAAKTLDETDVRF